MVIWNLDEDVKGTILFGSQVGISYKHQNSGGGRGARDPEGKDCKGCTQLREFPSTVFSTFIFFGNTLWLDPGKGAENLLLAEHSFYIQCLSTFEKQNAGTL